VLELTAIKKQKALFIIMLSADSLTRSLAEQKIVLEHGLRAHLRFLQVEAPYELADYLSGIALTD